MKKRKGRHDQTKSHRAETRDHLLNGSVHASEEEESTESDSYDAYDDEKYFEYDRDASRRFFDQGEEQEKYSAGAEEKIDEIEYEVDDRYAYESDYGSQFSDSGEYETDEYEGEGFYDSYGDPEDERLYEAHGQVTREGASARKRVRRKKKNTFRNIIIVILIGVGLYFIATSELFAIRGIEVSISGSHYTNEQIAMMSKIIKKDNLWKLNTGKIASELTKDPYIESADVGRRPPGTITISIVERVENCTVPLNGKYIVLDKVGIVLRVSDEAPPLPFIEGIDVKAEKLGEPIETSRDIMLSEAMKLLDHAVENGLAFKKIVLRDTHIVAYISDTLSASGVLENVNKDLAKVRSVLLDLGKQKIDRGTIFVNGDGTCTFSPEES